MRYFCALTLAGLSLAFTAQSSTPPPQFDVAAINLHDPNQRATQWGVSLQGLQVNVYSDTAIDLVEWAYDVKGYQVSGYPAWADSENYDLEAKTLAGSELTTPVAQRMMQSLLAARFQLKFHRDSKVMTAYRLEVAKDGVKMKPSTPDKEFSLRVQVLKGGGLQMTGVHCDMAHLLSMISANGVRDVPITDATGLTGTYDFTVRWQMVLPGPARADAADTDPLPPTIFSALPDQLGLNLVSAKTPVPTLIVDHIERPGAN